jgi:hypothetical protein
MIAGSNDKFPEFRTGVVENRQIFLNPGNFSMVAIADGLG